MSSGDDLESELELELELEAELDQEDSEVVESTLSDGELAFGGSAPTSVPVEMVISDCPGAKRLIGLLDASNDCTLGATVPAQWSGARLFEAGSPAVQAFQGSLPTHFERYCVFDYVGSQTDLVLADYAPLFAAIETSTTMSRDSVSADCRGDFAQGSLYDTTVGTQMQMSFMTNVDWEMGEGVVDQNSTRSPVEVAILDTVSQAVADAPTPSPTNRHGLQIGALVEEIYCPSEDSACLAGVRHFLALPREDWTTAPDWSGGGNHGTQGDLALSIFEAVHNWRARQVSEPLTAPKRLVLNLSLGWNSLDGLSNQITRGPAASLIAAMQYASCNEALIIASAGNMNDAACPSLDQGPLDPASFETFAAPSVSECVALGFTPPVGFVSNGDSTTYRPLVHAVGALNERDIPMINAREGGMPRIAALGANGVVDPGAEALAGSSVSAAVVSATAALLWSYRPELGPHDLIGTIYSSGWDTGTLADFHYGDADAPSVRRVSVCAALDAACTGQGANCPVYGCAATAAAADGHLTAVADAVDVVLADPVTRIESFSDAVVEPNACEAPEDINNLSSPQPELPVCSRCNLTKPPGFTTGDDAVSMTIDPSYVGLISELRLITSADGVRTTHRFGAQVVDSLNDQSTAVDITIAYVEAPTAVAAVVEFDLVDGSRQSNRIPVIER